MGLFGKSRKAAATNVDLDSKKCCSRTDLHKFLSWVQDLADFTSATDAAVDALSGHLSLSWVAQVVSGNKDKQGKVDGGLDTTIAQYRQLLDEDDDAEFIDNCLDEVGVTRY